MLGRMVVLAERDRALGRLAADQTAAIIDGTDQVLEFLGRRDEDFDGRAAAPELEPGSRAGAGRGASSDAVHIASAGAGEIDDAAAALIAFALRRRGLRRGRQPSRRPRRSERFIRCTIAYCG